MNARLTAIARRRTTLVAQAAWQRDALDRRMRPWQRRLALADRGIAFVRQLLHAHPFAIAVGAALLTRMRRGRLGVWGGRLWTAWAVYRSLQNHRQGDHVGVPSHGRFAEGEAGSGPRKVY